MRIGVIGSMQLTERMFDAAEALQHLGHDALVISVFAEGYVGKSDEDKEVLKIEEKNNQDAMRKDCERIKGVDAVLVMNLDKNGVANYIGGNTFLEIGYAHILDKKIYLYHPIPEIPYYKSELVAMKPIVINEDLTQITS